MGVGEPVGVGDGVVDGVGDGVGEGVGDGVGVRSRQASGSTLQSGSEVGTGVGPSRTGNTSTFTHVSLEYDRPAAFP
jgi:hypothetical protein